ncbi:type IV secretory system conjugative DNA transfer family protein [Kitasatospora sp. RB6PN24]|uniref:type IV secretory system conjugative DNA transfer family protein n=1 Tax=Kitasatospora humi TaxID=2893891 RepID=UPI001E416A2D|nr:type IV secretory system conjugative DNA transfer family protein [Kitasatospora humi]MCC9312075.1 type IV secretory system conjugative DNA transfer family protein [Kitasatospora humi]
MTIHTRLIVGTTGSGKTYRLRQLAAQHAADPTVTVWAISPYNELTDTDHHTSPDGAERMLAAALALVEQRRTHGPEHQPTPHEPHLRILVDEVEQVLRQPEAGRMLLQLALTGRPAAVDTVLTASTHRLDLWPLALRDLLADDTEHLPRPHPYTED